MKERSVAYFILIRFYTLLMTFLLVSSFKLFPEEGIAFKDNYEVYKELEGTDKTSIKKGMRLALRDLTIDISGNSEVINEPSIKKSLRDPERLITQYKLVSEKELIMGVFLFDGKALRELLSINKLPLWTGKKQKALLFLPCRNNILTSDDNNEDVNAYNNLCSYSSETLKKFALERNIILVEPSFDINDLNTIMFFKSYSNKAFLNSISSRYNLNYWSICKIQDEFGLLLQEAKCSTSVSGDEYFSIKEMVNILANETNKEVQIQVDNDQETFLNLEFSGIDQLSDFMELEALINSIVLIKSSELISLKGNTLIYEMEIKGESADLQKLMDSNPLLNRKKIKDLDKSSLISYSLVKI